MKRRALLLARRGMRRRADPLAEFQDRPENDGDNIEHAGQGRQGAKRKSPEKRFRQDREHEKIDRKRNHDCPEESGVSKGRNEQLREQEQSADVGHVRDQQDGDEQPLRPLRQPLQAKGRGLALLDVMAQPHRIDREQPGFDPGEEKRHRPAAKNEEGVGHDSFASLPVCSIAVA